MQQEGDMISPSLFDEFGEQERVEELFPDNGAVDVLEGLIALKQTAEPISSEDLAWVDSCLIADPELPMENWFSLKEALLDSITSFVTSYEVNNGEEDEDKAGNSSEHMELSDDQKIFDDDGGDAVHIRSIRIDEDEVRHRDHDSYDARKVETLGAKKEVESRESIFKVWDLREEGDDELIPELQRAVRDLRVGKEEDDRFVTELNRAVAESIIREKQKLATDEAAIADDRMLDELISTMGDLSIKSLS